MGLALLLAIPLLALVLIRMLWSGSTLWFLLAGIVFLGASAAAFLARRNEPSFGYPTLAPEPNRLPLVLLGLGALFLAFLILPNVSGSSTPSSVTRLQPGAIVSLPTQANQPVAQPTVAQPMQRSQPTAEQPTQMARAEATPLGQPSTSTRESTERNPPAGSQVYLVQNGDTLWDIAQQFDVSVDDIVAANNLDNADSLQLGQELIIPPASSDTASDVASEPETAPE